MLNFRPFLLIFWLCLVRPSVRLFVFASKISPYLHILTDMGLSILPANEAFGMVFHSTANDIWSCKEISFQMPWSNEPQR